MKNKIIWSISLFFLALTWITLGLAEESEFFTEPIVEEELTKYSENKKKQSLEKQAVKKKRLKFNYKPPKKVKQATNKNVVEKKTEIYEEQELKTEPIYEEEVENEGIVFKTELSKSQVHLDESFTLKVEIIVPELAKLSKLRMPNLKNFKLINSFESDAVDAVYRKGWKAMYKKYIFLGKAPGRYRIPAMKMNYQGQEYTTKELNIRVEGSRSGSGYAKRSYGQTDNNLKEYTSAPAISQRKSDRITLSAELSQSEIYVNQQVKLIVKIGYKIDENTTMKYFPPTLTGFFIENLPEKKSEEVISGSDYKYVDRIFTTVLFPVKTGKLEIGAAQVMFTKEIKSISEETEPLVVKVKPLPRDPDINRYKQKSGLVGSFSLNVKTGDTKVEVEKPWLIEVILKGTGNIRVAPEPCFLNIPKSNFYLEKKTEKILVKQGEIGGEKKYQYIVIFKKPGIMDKAQVVARYFDPYEKKWMSAKTKISKIEIIPSSKRSKTVKVQKAPLKKVDLKLQTKYKTPKKIKTQKLKLVERITFWWFQIAGLIILILIGAGKYVYIKMKPEPKVLRSRRAYRIAKRNLGKIRRHINVNEVEDFYMDLSRITSEYLAAKLQLPLAYIGVERLTDYFEEYEIPEELLDKFRVALTACEYVRYAAVELPKEDMWSLYRDVKVLLKNFQKFWKKRSKLLKSTVKIFLIGLGIFCCTLAYAGEKEVHFMKGKSYADKGQHELAEVEYKKVITLGGDDAALYFNLGNVYLFQNKLGLAILSYKRGLLRAPRAHQIKYNLRQARRLIEEAEKQVKKSGIKKLVIGFYKSFTVDELTLIASVIYFLIIINIILIIIWPQNFLKYKLIPIILGFVLILISIWTSILYWEKSWNKQAVVLAEEAKIYTRPYSESEVIYIIPEGSEVEIKREQEEWVEVFFYSKRRGWTQRSILGRVN